MSIEVDLNRAYGIVKAMAAVMADRDMVDGKRSHVIETAEQATRAIQSALDYIRVLEGKYSATLKYADAEKTKNEELQKVIAAMREERGATVIATPCVPQYGAGTGSQEG